MLGVERRTEILRLVRKSGAVKVAELALHFSVAEETIRRDIQKLDQEGHVQKTYGGAVLSGNLSEDLPYSDREKRNLSEKQTIAKAAQSFIENGDTIFIDASTTAFEVAKAIDPKKRVTIITNSILAITKLTGFDHLTVIGVGGVVNDQLLAMEGPVTTKFIDLYNADKCFFSVKGITLEKGLMDPREITVDIKLHMIQNAKTVFLVADESKFGQYARVGYIDLDAVDYLVTDHDLGEAYEAYFKQYEIEVVKA